MSRNETRFSMNIGEEDDEEEDDDDDEEEEEIEPVFVRESAA